MRRNTQDPAYWENFRATDKDLEQISNLLVEREVPLPLDELARAVVAFRCQEEEERIARELARGSLYLPHNHYEVGEKVVFPLLEYALAQVVTVRAGHNPEFGDFRVIEVEFPNGRRREFAADLADHPLNHAPQVTTVDLRPAEDLYQEFKDHVRAALNERLEADVAFIRLAGEWFLRELIVDINRGQLNLAEAVLDMAGGGPLPTAVLMQDLDLPREIDPQLGVFSLNFALQEDDRFDEVGPAGEVLWYLRRLEPAEVLEPPNRLQPRVLEYDHRLLDETMLNLTRRLDDEWSDLMATPEREEPLTVVLTYPHLRSGTLPLSPRMSRLFPTGRTHRIRFTFRDGRNGDEMPGWVVRERRFVYGLAEWYRRNHITVGSYIDLERSAEPGVIHVRCRPIRQRREWVRVVSVADGRLSFEMMPQLLACEYDDLAMIVVEDMAALDELATQMRRERQALSNVLREVFSQLTKLSPQGTVHAATLYSAANLLARTPPGPILSALVADEWYVSVGDNYWVTRGRGLGF